VTGVVAGGDDEGGAVVAIDGDDEGDLGSGERRVTANWACPTEAAQSTAPGVADGSIVLRKAGVFSGFVRGRLNACPTNAATYRMA